MMSNKEKIKQAEKEILEKRKNIDNNKKSSIKDKIKDFIFNTFFEKEEQDILLDTKRRQKSKDISCDISWFINFVIFFAVLCIGLGILKHIQNTLTLESVTKIVDTVMDFIFSGDIIIILAIIIPLIFVINMNRNIYNSMPWLLIFFSLFVGFFMINNIYQTNETTDITPIESTNVSQYIISYQITDFINYHSFSSIMAIIIIISIILNITNRNY